MPPRCSKRWKEPSLVNSSLVSKTQHLHLHLQTDLAPSLLLLSVLPPLFSASPSFLGIWADNYGAALWPISFQLHPPGEMSPNKLGETVQICSTQTERHENESQHSSFKR